MVVVFKAITVVYGFELYILNHFFDFFVIASWSYWRISFEFDILEHLRRPRQ